MDTRILAGLTVFLMVAGSNAINEVELGVNEVIIYPQSVALVYESGTEGSGTEFIAGINKNAYVNSIRVSGASEVSISTRRNYPTYYSGFVETPLKQLLKQVLGKRVIVGSVEGVLEWITDSWIGISNSTNFITMPTSNVDSIISSEPLQEPNETRAEGPESVINVTWKSNGDGQVMVSYLANGLSWTPVYFLDAGDATSKFEFWAKIDNGFEDLDANVKLIGGDIRIGGGRPYRDYTTATQAAMAPMEAEAGGEYFEEAPTVSTAGEYEVYDLGQKDIKKGESRLISIFSGTVIPEKRYVWDTRAGNRVQRIYIVKNPGRTWPYGSVKVYENGMLMGEDTISWTPEGRKARITIGNAPDIEVSKKTTSIDIGSYRQKHITTLKLKNYKPKEVLVNLIDTYPPYIDQGSFESSEEFVKKPGNLMELNVTLSAGEQKEITYSYTT